MKMQRTLLFFFCFVPFTAIAGWESIGNVEMVLRSDQQIVLLCGPAQVQITPFTAKIVNVRVVRDNKQEPPNSWGVIMDKLTPPKYVMEEDSCSLTIQFPDYTILVKKKPFRISFISKEGEIINRDDSSKGMGWDGEQVRIWKAMPEAELYYGFGEKAGRLERRAGAMTNWNTDIPAYSAATDPVYQTIPYFIGMKNGKAHGIFFDNSFRSSFDMGKESDSYYSFGADGGEINYYFIYGPHPKDVVRQFSDLTGKMNLPPLWSIGYQQSRWSYFPDSKVREIAETFRKKKIPADVIYLDIDYMEGYRVFTWSGENFPEPKKLIGELGAMGFKTAVIIDPGIKIDSNYSVYREMIAGSHYVKNPDGTPAQGKVWPGECLFPDYANSRTRAWWGASYKGLVDDGIKGFWNDMNEPSVFDVPSKTLPKNVLHDADGKTITHAEFHNVYGMQMVRGTYEGVLALRPNERPFVLTRAAYTGTQRYSAAWTGDNVASWEHMAMSIPMCLNLGLSGQPFAGPDIGGFVGSPTGELYTRWLQFGALMPFCRTHTEWGSKPQEPWSFGEKFEAINKRSIELRYRLLPYLYTQFYRSSTDGLPVMRPLLLEYPSEWGVKNLDSEFLIGEDLLVAPILAPEAVERDVYFPSGVWFDFHTKKKITGGGWKKVSAPVDSLPLFVRGGSIIPQQQPMQYTGEKPVDPLTYEIYPISGSASGLLYEDDGISFDYQKGIFRRTEISLSESKSVTTISLSKPQGSFSPLSRSVIFRLYDRQRKPFSVSVNSKSLPRAQAAMKAAEGWFYDNRSKMIVIKLPESNEERKIEIQTE